MMYIFFFRKKDLISLKIKVQLQFLSAFGEQVLLIKKKKERRVYNCFALLLACDDVDDEDSSR